MSALRPEDLVRRYPERDFLIAEGGAGAAYVVAMHRAFYRFARDALSDRGRVLDAGCGTGIGTEILAERSGRTMGVDLKPLLLRYAAERHGGGPRYAATDATRLAFRDESFDAVVADELLEHLPDARAFLREAVRVLRPDGVFICATVNARLTFGTGDRPANRNHFREYEPEAFRAELGRYFHRVTVLGQAAGEAYRRFARPVWARGVERALMYLGVKHRIPAELRTRVRSWLTGSDTAAVVEESQFAVGEEGVEEAVYLVGVARRPRRLNDGRSGGRPRRPARPAGPTR